ncbi:MAG: hypothetical protein LBQ12_13675 [Deltaproteobacteria bacterium]|nr:hypothetical protein [Deltaproteobacteria bacterium]
MHDPDRLHRRPEIVRTAFLSQGGYGRFGVRTKNRARNSGRTLVLPYPARLEYSGRAGAVMRFRRDVSADARRLALAAKAARAAVVRLAVAPDPYARGPGEVASFMTRRKPG